MEKPYIYVSTVIRGSTSAELTGMFYKIDWRTKKVVAKLPVPTKYIRGARGGSRGGRGMAALDKKIFAATFDKVIVYTPEFQLLDVLTHPLVIGHHEIHVDPKGIWCCSTLLDAFVRLSHSGEMMDSCFLGEQEDLTREGYRRVVHDRGINYLELCERDEDGKEKFDEQFHANTVVVQPNGEVHGFTHANGFLLRIRPDFKILARMWDLWAAHNVQIIDGRLFVNHTRERAFQIYDFSDLDSPRVHISLDEGTGPSEQFATPGFIRGLCFVTPRLMLVGTSPAGLISVNLETCRVEERFCLESEVSHAVHGLCSSEA